MRRWCSTVGTCVVGLVVALFLVVAFADLATAQEEDRFDFIIKGEAATGGHLGTAEYSRSLEGGGVWLDGDRVGYRLVYGFADCNTANKGLNLRAAAFGYGDGADTAIFDRYMDEGERRWGGAVEPDGVIPAKESNAPVRESHGAGFATSVPVIELFSGDRICEIRDYHNVVDQADNVTFAVVSESPTEVIVGWYIDGEPAVEFYYEILKGSYRLRVTSG